jgi:pyruvate,water dikinase
VKDASEVVKSVRDCFASVFTKQAVSYLRQNNKSTESIKMSVVIQKMVPSETSGILLTADAIRRRQYLASIDAIWGVGEAIVQGMVTPDTYTVNKHSLKIEKVEIQGKEKLLICNPSQSGLETKEVPLEKTHTSTLSEAQICQLVSIGIKLESFFEYFQDIEWAIYKDEIYLLQSRPLAGSLLYQKDEEHVA